MKPQAVDLETGSPDCIRDHAAPALSVRGICKTYGPVKALLPASLDLCPGEVHALVGENGSGKSTFVGIVSGTVKADAGTFAIAGTVCTRATPAESQNRGALTVFQDGSVFSELTIAQNLYLGTPAGQRPAYGEIEAWARQRLAEFGLGRLSVGPRAGTLSPADRQLLEIVRALMARPTVLLLDEATSALDAAGVDRALDLMRQAADQGTAVLFVTHRLAEVFRVADRISVLRDGAWEGTYDAQTVNAEQLVELMAGAGVDQEFPERADPAKVGEVLLSGVDLAHDRFGPVDVTLRAGEIVGIAGADDNGQHELLRGLAGVGVPDGQLEINGKRVVDYADAVEAGVLLLSGDKLNESLFAPLPVRENIAAGVVGQLSSRGGVINMSRESDLVDEVIRRFGIRLESPDQPVTSLSGGNQQKVALGRVLATEPMVLIVDEPTQGVDVRSRMDIYRRLRDTANQGLAVLVNSSDASEIAGLCDRILVVSRGRIVDRIPAQEASEERIVAAFAGAEHAHSADEVTPYEPEDSAAAHPKGRRLLARLRQVGQRHHNAVRTLMLIGLIVLLGAYAQAQNPTFLTTPSLFNIFLLTVPLATVAAAQFFVLYVGGIDISVGATMGVTVAVMSFLVQQNASFMAGLLVAIAIAMVVGILIGALNASLTEGVRISPVIATIATLGIMSGFGLLLRPTPEGLISADLAAALTSSVWAVPWVLIVLAALFMAGDWILRSTGHGLRLRSVGLNSAFAYRLGINATRLRVLSYVLCGVLAALAGVFLAGQIGIGDPRGGAGFTLLAIAAPVLGGASLFGGYGTLVGALLGALVLVLAQTLPTILGINVAWGFILTGGLTLLALLAYTGGAGAMLRRAVRTARRKAARATSK